MIMVIGNCETHTYFFQVSQLPNNGWVVRRAEELRAVSSSVYADIGIFQGAYKF